MSWRLPMLIAFIVAGVLSAFWLLLQTPGTLSDALAHPFEALAGTGRNLNATLLDVSESPDAEHAGQRLLQPLGIVRLERFYDVPDSSDKNLSASPAQKNDPHNP